MCFCKTASAAGSGPWGFDLTIAAKSLKRKNEKKQKLHKIWLDAAPARSKMVSVSAERNRMRGYLDEASEIASIKSDTTVT
jgi:hypothetical protein